MMINDKSTILNALQEKTHSITFWLSATSCLGVASLLTVVITRVLPLSSSHELAELKIRGSWVGVG
jgi:hypothetical protein